MWGAMADTTANPSRPAAASKIPRRKRALDVALAFTVLAVGWPVLATAALAVRMRMGRPILFRHVRAGRGGSPFEILKFRTMRPPRSGEALYLSDQDRLTPLGRFLRATSIDELPELLNVLRGHMSLVGPRPLPTEYLPNYTQEEHRRHSMPPGITGLAQVSGRQDLTFSKRLSLDLWYIDNWTLRLDLKILARTLKQVVMLKGVRSGQSIEDVDDLGLLDGRTQTHAGSGDSAPGE